MSGGLESGGLETRATDFGSGIPCTWSGGLVSGGLVSGGLEALRQPISDLEFHMPVLKKHYRGPLFRFAPFV